MSTELSKIKEYLDKNPEAVEALKGVLSQLGETVRKSERSNRIADPLGQVFEGTKALKEGQSAAAQAEEIAGLVGSFLVDALKSLL